MAAAASISCRVGSSTVLVAAKAKLAVARMFAMEALILASVSGGELVTDTEDNDQSMIAFICISSRSPRKTHHVHVQGLLDPG